VKEVKHGVDTWHGYAGTFVYVHTVHIYILYHSMCSVTVISAVYSNFQILIFKCVQVYYIRTVHVMFSCTFKLSLNGDTLLEKM